MHAGMEPRSLESPAAELSTSDDDNLRDEERAFDQGAAPSSVSGRSHDRSSSTAADETELQPRASSVAGSATGYVKRKTSQLLQSITPSSHPGDTPLPPRLQALVDIFGNSAIFAALKQDLEEVSRTADLPDVAVENSVTRGRKRAGWGTQFRILSGRAFKNLYRDPALLITHYSSAVAVACWCSLTPLAIPVLMCFAHPVICGFFYHNVTYVPGQQCTEDKTDPYIGFIAMILLDSRTDWVGCILLPMCFTFDMRSSYTGVFFFTLALFGFSSLSSLSLFANERILFMRERYCRRPPRCRTVR